MLKAQYQENEESRTFALLDAHRRTRDRGERQRIEDEIAALGAEAVAPLTVAARTGTPDENQQRKKALLLAGALVLAAFSGYGVVTGTGSAPLLAPTVTFLFVALMNCFTTVSGTRPLPLRLLMRVDDPRTIDPLAGALSPAGPTTPFQRDVQKRLAYLLPRLRREDGAALANQTKMALRSQIDRSFTNEFTREEDVDFIVAVIKGLVQIGDPEVRLHLKWAWKEAHNERIRQMAEKGIDELDRQAGERQTP